MKAALLQRLYRWRKYLQMITTHTGDEPAFIPLTREEIEILKDRYVGDEKGYFIGDISPKMFGLEAQETSYAVLQRQRMLTMPVTRLAEVDRVDLSFEYVRDVDHECARYLHRRMVARICTDTTQLLIRLEWDILAKFKRALRITKWFPVKWRTVAIQGTVLYPYLNVTLPHNRHVVQFAVR